MESHSSHLTEGESRIRRFLESETDGVFVLKGKYGSGKSYFLRESVLGRMIPKDEVLKGKFRFFSYTSVFGLNQMSTLTDAAIGSMDLFAGRGMRADGWGAKVRDLFADLGPKFLQGLGPDLPTLTLLWRVAHKFGLLLVIDDIDRRGPALQLREIIGFATALVEQTQSRVKVILVINEDELQQPDRGEWEALREKFIDGEFAFQPSPRELALRFIKDPRLAEEIAKIHQGIGSANIRSMLKTESLTLEAERYLAKHGSVLVEEEVAHTAQLAALFLGAGKAYPVERIVDDRLSWLDVLAGSKDLPEDFKILTLKADLMGFQPNEPLDRLLIVFFQNGWIAPEAITSFTDARAEQGRVEAYNRANRSLWSALHMTFRDTTVEFIEAANKLVREYTSQVDRSGVLEITDVLKKLGADIVPVWREWLGHHAANLTAKEIEALRGRIPVELHGLLPSQKIVEADEVDPSTLFRFVENDEPLRDQTYLRRLAKFTAEEWVQWFEAAHYPEIVLGARNLLRLSSRIEEVNQIQNAVREALSVLGDKTPMNRLRAERYFPEMLREGSGSPTDSK
ncbi:MAG: hypothetical protein JNJ70_13085 [Verrucomicrobiales bacterium]|nr:hypothetical protein [Verrucomicrobiales bacterium]